MFSIVDPYDTESVKRAIKRKAAAQLMGLSPTVCGAAYRGEPLPIGWNDQLDLRPGAINYRADL